MQYRIMVNDWLVFAVYTLVIGNVSGTIDMHSDEDSSGILAMEES